MDVLGLSDLSRRVDAGRQLRGWVLLAMWDGAAGLVGGHVEDEPRESVRHCVEKRQHEEEPLER